MKKYSLSGAFLKNVAYLSMFIDHFFAVVFIALLQWKIWQDSSAVLAEGVYQAGRAIGRIAFILFAFMAAEGFRYTHSRRRYLLRLGIFAFLSELPFDLAIYDEMFEPKGQNVYFTLFFGVLALCLIDKLRGNRFGQFLGVVLCCAAVTALRTDYMFMGVLLIVVFYNYRERFLYLLIVGSITIYAGIVLLYMVRYWGNGIGMTTFLQMGTGELYGLFAFVFLYFYNGKKGRQFPKLCYYLFYPLHLLFLYGLRVAAHSCFFPGGL